MLDVSVGSTSAWYRNDGYQLPWGDADRLANGNVLVTADGRGEGTASRIFESPSRTEESSGNSTRGQICPFTVPSASRHPW